VVIVGADLAPALAAAGLPRRPYVVVVLGGPPDTAVWKAAVDLGAQQVVTVPDDERSLLELLAAALDDSDLDGVTIGVIGACGGAGASTFAAALAVTAARSASSALIDGDRLGGGIDVLIGAEHRPGARWPELAATRGRLASATLSGALPGVDGLAVLSWDRAGTAAVDGAAAAAVADAGRRAFRWVVVDLPRRFDATASALAGAADILVLVVPATVRATAAAAALIEQQLSQCAAPQLVIRDANPAHLSATHIGAALGLPVAAGYRSESAVAGAAARGEPPLRRARGSLHEACRSLLATASAGQVAA
jgi:secretion/DNA translocation related CpaE-like protein